MLPIAAQQPQKGLEGSLTSVLTQGKLPWDIPRFSHMPVGTFLCQFKVTLKYSPSSLGVFWTFGSEGSGKGEAVET